MGIGRIDIGERRQVEKLQPLHIILKDDTVSSTVHSIEDIGEIYLQHINTQYNKHISCGAS